MPPRKLAGRKKDEIDRANPVIGGRDQPTKPMPSPEVSTRSHPVLFAAAMMALVVACSLSVTPDNASAPLASSTAVATVEPAPSSTPAKTLPTPQPPPTRPPFDQHPSSAYGSLATITVDRLSVWGKAFGDYHWPYNPRELRNPNDLAAGTVVLLSRGPLEVDGHDWYELRFVPLPGEPFTSVEYGWGWVRTGPTGTVPTEFTLDPIRCPNVITPGVLSVMTNYARLGCLAGDELAMTGEIAECTPDTAVSPMSSWAFADCLDLIGSEAGDIPLTMFLPPDVSRADLAPGVSVRVVGHLDDPEADNCRREPVEGEFVVPAADEYTVMECRAAFVVDTIEVN